QHADLLRVEAVEAPDRGDALVEIGFGHEMAPMQLLCASVNQLVDDVNYPGVRVDALAGTAPPTHIGAGTIEPSEGKMAAREVLEKSEALSKQQSGLPILGPRKGKLLAELVRKHKPRHVLEVGTLIGYSAILMAGELPPGGRVTCVELSPDNAAKARKNF